MSENSSKDKAEFQETAPQMGGTLKFQDTKQKKIREALVALDGKMGQKIAAIYDGVLIANGNQNNPERHAQVAHSIRELTSVLPRYFVGLPQSVKVTRVGEIISPEAWKAFCEWFDLRPVSEPPPDVTEFVSKISKALNDGGQKKKLEQVLDQHPSRNALPAYQREVFAKKWSDNHAWFVKHAHHHDVHNGIADSELGEAEFNRRIAINDDLLYQALVRPPFFEALPEIDALLAIDKPTPQDVEKLVLLTAYEEQNRYFFERCVNAEWLDPLQKKNAFSVPRPPRREDNYIQFLPWPESGFLARVADRKPKEVFDIVKEIKTENQSVLSDIVSAALASPAEIAAEYVGLIEKGNWLDNPYRTGLSSRVADLVEKLWREGQPKSALQLAYTLFDVKPSPRYNFSEAEKTDHMFDRSDAKGLCDDWEFGEFLEKKTIGLAGGLPVDFFHLLVRKLSKANDIEERAPKAADDFYDYSHIWRPTLTKPRRSQEDVKNLLLDRIIDLILQYKDNPAVLSSFLDILGTEKGGIFKRVELFVYFSASKHFTSQIEKVLKDTRYLHSHSLRKEFVLLLHQNFMMLSQDVRESIIEMIDAGHPLMKVREGWSQDDIDAAQREWKSVFLTPIKEHLPADVAEKYDALIKRDWSEEDFLAEGEVRSWGAGNPSPASVEDLESMEPEKVLDLLLSHEPAADDLTSSSVSDLAQNFERVVATTPELFAALASKFLEKKLRPKFIYHFLHGLKTAVRDGRCFEWASVVGFVSDVVAASHGALVVSKEHEQDWDSVKQAIADLLGDALGQKTCDLPIAHRSKIWATLERLSDDADPSPDDEKGRDGNLDPMSLSINTIRGEAMHAVVNYGLWCARHGVTEADGTLMPKELEAALNKHLDLNHDPSLAVRSVYGWRLPNISYLSIDWARKNVDGIFPADEKHRLLFAAALQGVLANGIYQELVELLGSKYKTAIDLLHVAEEKGYRALDVHERLPQHLMVVYVRDPSRKDIVDYFFQSAPVKARAEAISYLGRQTLEEISVLPDPTASKAQLVQLWRDRLTGNGGVADVEELKEFGWWFRHDAFDKKICIDLFIETLKKTEGKVEVPYRIMEQLPHWVDDFPEEVADVLLLIAKGQHEHYQIDYNEHRDLIASLKQSTSTIAKGKANELIQYLGEQGYIGLGDLLSLN